MIVLSFMVKRLPFPLAVIAAVTSGGNASDVAKTKSPSGMECRVLALEPVSPTSEGRITEVLRKRVGCGAGQFLIIAASLPLDFADLDGGLGVGVVGDTGQDRLRVRRVIPLGRDTRPLASGRH
jgi:hypothetical protein